MRRSASVSSSVALGFLIAAAASYGWAFDGAAQPQAGAIAPVALSMPPLSAAEARAAFAPVSPGADAGRPAAPVEAVAPTGGPSPSAALDAIEAEPLLVAGAAGRSIDGRGARDRGSAGQPVAVQRARARRRGEAAGRSARHKQCRRGRRRARRRDDERGRDAAGPAGLRRRACVAGRHAGRPRAGSGARRGRAGAGSPFRTCQRGCGRGRAAGAVRGRRQGQGAAADRRLLCAARQPAGMDRWRPHHDLCPRRPRPAGACRGGRSRPARLRGRAGRGPGRRGDRTGPNRRCGNRHLDGVRDLCPAGCQWPRRCSGDQPQHRADRQCGRPGDDPRLDRDRRRPGRRAGRVQSDPSSISRPEAQARRASCRRCRGAGAAAARAPRPDPEGRHGRCAGRAAAHTPRRDDERWRCLR